MNPSARYNYDCEHCFCMKNRQCQNPGCPTCNKNKCCKCGHATFGTSLPLVTMEVYDGRMQ